MAVFKFAVCGCGHKLKDSSPKKATPACPRCSGVMRYSDNWHISYQLHGKKYIQSVAPQKRDAEAALGKIKGEIREGRHFDKAPSTPWYKATQQFRTWISINVKPSTRNMYENCLKMLEPHFEAHTLDKITAPMVEQFKAVRSLTVKPATVNRDIATIKRLFSLAEQWGLLEVNRIRRVRLLRENNARVRFLTVKEIDRLFKACDDPTIEYDPKKKEWIKIEGAAERGNSLLRLAVHIALDTGLRKDSVLTLKWAEIDFHQGMVSKQTKGDKTVHIPLTDGLRDAMLAHKRNSKVLSQYVLPSDRKHGAPLKDLKKSFSSAIKRSQIKDFRFHDLRHTFASHFLMRTGDLKALQEILGHSDLKMTMRYAHLLNEHKVRAMKAYEKGAQFSQSD